MHILESLFYWPETWKCSTALEIERGLKRSHACKVAKKIERRKALVKNALARYVDR